ncbi:hypothetical protein [Candidatus Phytoplasma asteris]
MKTNNLSKKSKSLLVFSLLFLVSLFFIFNIINSNIMANGADEETPKDTAVDDALSKLVNEAVDAEVSQWVKDEDKDSVTNKVDKTELVNDAKVLQQVKDKVTTFAAQVKKTFVEKELNQVLKSSEVKTTFKTNVTKKVKTAIKVLFDEKVVALLKEDEEEEVKAAIKGKAPIVENKLTKTVDELAKEAIKALVQDKAVTLLDANTEKTVKDEVKSEVKEVTQKLDQKVAELAQEAKTVGTEDKVAKDTVVNDVLSKLVNEAVDAEVSQWVKVEDKDAVTNKVDKTELVNDAKVLQQVKDKVTTFAAQVKKTFVEKELNQVLKSSEVKTTFKTNVTKKVKTAIKVLFDEKVVALLKEDEEEEVKAAIKGKAPIVENKLTKTVDELAKEAIKALVQDKAVTLLDANTEKTVKDEVKSEVKEVTQKLDKKVAELAQEAKTVGTEDKVAKDTVVNDVLSKLVNEAVDAEVSQWVKVEDKDAVTNKVDKTELVNDAKVLQQVKDKVTTFAAQVKKTFVEKELNQVLKSSEVKTTFKTNVTKKVKTAIKVLFDEKVVALLKEDEEEEVKAAIKGKAPIVENKLTKTVDELAKEAIKALVQDKAVTLLDANTEKTVKDEVKSEVKEVTQKLDKKVAELAQEAKTVGTEDKVAKDTVVNDVLSKLVNEAVDAEVSQWVKVEDKDAVTNKVDKTKITAKGKFANVTQKLDKKVAELAQEVFKTYKDKTKLLVALGVFLALLVFAVFVLYFIKKNKNKKLIK